MGRRLRLLGDDRLGRLVAQGGEDAFVVLYERHHQAIYRYCRAIVRDEQDAQDALQSAMERALAALRRAPLEAPVRPWLFRIAHNEAVNVLRRRRPTEPLDGLIEDVGAMEPERSAATRARLAALLGDLAQLSARQRSALVMRELSGLSHAEIGMALAVSTGAAKQAIFEARSALVDIERGRAMACDEVCRALSDADGRALRARGVRAHLRDCTECRDFQAAIKARKADFAALAPPLPVAAAAALLARSLAGGAGHSAGVGTGSAVGTAASGVAAKALVGAVLVAGTVAAGHVAGVPLPGDSSRHADSPAGGASVRPGPAVTSRAPALTTSPRLSHAAPADARSVPANDHHGHGGVHEHGRSQTVHGRAHTRPSGSSSGSSSRSSHPPTKAVPHEVAHAPARPPTSSRPQTPPGH